MKYKLSSREKEILFTIVDCYIKSASPVGSRTVAKKSKLNLSSATIRNVMQDLEEMGFLYQPHTSAGRIPSSKGYRFFVDYLLKIKNFALKEIAIIEKKIKEIEQEKLMVTEMIKATLKIIAELTNCIAITTITSSENIKISRISLVKLDNYNLMIIIALSNSEVLTDTIKLKNPLDYSILEALEKFLNLELRGIKIKEFDRHINFFYETRLSVLNDYKSLLEDSINIIKKILKSENFHMILEGKDNIFNIPEFKKLDKIKTIINYLESKEELYKLLTKLSDLSIIIGEEEKKLKPQDISLISAPYENPIFSGYFALIGPLRMDYRKNIPAVLKAVERLSRFCGEI